MCWEDFLSTVQSFSEDCWDDYLIRWINKNKVNPLMENMFYTQEPIEALALFCKKILKSDMNLSEEKKTL